MGVLKESLGQAKDLERENNQVTETEGKGAEVEEAWIKSNRRSYAKTGSQEQAIAYSYQVLSYCAREAKKKPT